MSVDSGTMTDRVVSRSGSKSGRKKDSLCMTIGAIAVAGIGGAAYAHILITARN